MQRQCTGEGASAATTGIALVVAALAALMLAIGLSATAYADDAVASLATGTITTMDDGSATAPEQDSDGYYLIGTAAELTWFRDKVNGLNGLEADGSICARLTADIDLEGSAGNPWTPINTFGGAIDGQGHMVSGIYASGTMRVGLVMVNNGTIKNLVISNSTVVATGAQAGAICAQNSGKVLNCIVASDVSVSAGMMVGGLCATSIGGSTLANCVSYASVSSTGMGNVGGIAGMCQGTAANCLALGTVAYNGTNANANVGAVFGGTGNVAPTACYALSTTAVEKSGAGYAGTAATPEEMASDSMVKLFNDYVDENADEGLLAWMAGSTAPVFYKYAPEQDEDGCYLLDSKEALEWFRDKVNAGDTAINAKLTADIALNDTTSENWTETAEEWEPIGFGSAPYEGVFDGQGFSISGMYIPNATGKALFVQLSGKGAVIKNLMLKASVVEATGNNVALICATVAKGAMVLNCATADDCSISIASGPGIIMVGGIACTLPGTNDDGYGSVINCANNAAIEGANFTGGVVNNAFNGTLANCYNTGTVTSSGTMAGSIYAFSQAGATISNVYCLDETALAKETDDQKKTAAEFADGTVLAALNDYVASSDVDGICAWGQQQSYPVLVVGKTALPEPEAIDAQMYSGEQITPSVAGLDGYTAGIDYIVTYDDNTEVGTGSVTVVAADGTMLYGSYTIEFDIVADKTALTEAIYNAFEKLMQSGTATAEAKAALAAALDAARAVDADPSATEEDVAEAVAMLEAAVEAFEESADEPDPDPEPDPEPIAPATASTRFAGAVALDTMSLIVQEGFADGSCGAVVVASLDGYWDALAASSLAGQLGCPVLMTDPNSLSAQTASEIARLGAEKAYIAGGTAAVSANVESQLKARGLSVERLWGADAQVTAVKIAGALGSDHASTCVIATSGGYWDALSASPYAYAQVAPVFLTDGDGVLRADTLAAIEAGGYDSAVIAGGTAAVDSSAEAALKAAGVASVRRCGGADAYGTAVLLAKWELSQGMEVARIGVATSANGYWDALSGAALCGVNNSVIVLADGGATSAIDELVAPYASAIEAVNVFGGTAAVDASVDDAIAAALAVNR